MAMKLMKDTGSLTNYLLENDKHEIRVGDSFAELMWTDRHLWQVTAIDGKRMWAKRVRTYMEHWADGTEYPVKDDAGKWELEGKEHCFTKPRKNWKMDGKDVHLSWGATTGYRDPSF